MKKKYAGLTQSGQREAALQNDNVPEKGGRIRALGRYLLFDEAGIGVIEVVLILVVLIALVLLFRDRITDLLKTIFDQINSSASEVWTS